MKITGKLMLGYLTAAVFGVECCINAKILPGSLGERGGNRAVEASLVAPHTISYWRSASGANSARADLFEDQLSPIAPVRQPSDNFIQSQENPQK
jgi:hypothetical protein